MGSWGANGIFSQEEKARKKNERKGDNALKRDIIMFYLEILLLFNFNVVLIRESL